MKHIAFTLLLTLLSFSQLVGNPIPPPMIISEIYFEGINWTIELAYGEEWGEPLFLDECTLISSAGETTFNEGTVLFPDSILLITEDDITTPLFIDKNGDFINIMGSFVDDRVCVGDYLGSNVNAPYEGQSLARVIFEIYNPPWNDIYFCLVKNNTPSLGSNSYYVDTKGTFSGYVFDQQQNPIPNAQIHYFYYCDDIYTDQNGYFEDNYMYGMNYNVTVYVDDIAMMDTLITIEPDSTTYCEFYLDLYSIDEEQLQSRQLRLTNYPNPFIESTTISLSATDLHGFSQINIYNIKGQLVKEFKIQNYKFKINEIEWDGKSNEGILQPPGFYFYSLEVDGNRIKTNKMIMVR